MFAINHVLNCILSPCKGRNFHLKISVDMSAEIKYKSEMKMQSKKHVSEGHVCLCCPEVDTVISY